MYWVFILLYNEKYQEDVLLALASRGCTDAVILDGTTVGSMMSNVPIFAGFKADLFGNSHYMKMIAVIAPSRQALDGLIDDMRSSKMDFPSEENGKIFITPCEEIGPK